MTGKDAALYMIFLVISAIIGSAILFALVSTGGYDGSTATGSNGFGDGEMLQAFIAEMVFTFIFVLVHIVCIPITGTSVNPARSIGPALFEGGADLSQLWLFIVAPFVGAVGSAIVWKIIGSDK